MQYMVLPQVHKYYVGGVCKMQPSRTCYKHGGFYSSMVTILHYGSSMKLWSVDCFSTKQSTRILLNLTIILFINNEQKYCESVEPNSHLGYPSISVLWFVFFTNYQWTFPSFLFHLKRKHVFYFTNSTLIECCTICSLNTRVLFAFHSLSDYCELKLQNMSTTIFHKYKPSLFCLLNF